MATHESVPNGDYGTMQWTQYPSSPTTHYDKIDEDHSSPSSSDYNYTLSTNKVDEFEMTAPTISGNIESITIYIHTPITIGTIYISIYNGSDYEAEQGVPSSGSMKWSSKTFSGLSMNQTNVNNFRVKVRSGADVFAVQINTMYAELVEVEGWGHKLCGILNPSKIMGGTYSKVKGV